jgi:hypothetical protein
MTLFFCIKVIKLKSRHTALHEVVSKDLVVDDSRTRRLAVEISYFEKYRYAQLQNRELKTELIRVRIETCPSRWTFLIYVLECFSFDIA